ncbi:hypothetical protein EK21DRAFT_92435 [Setomelanomma holmii]|uniref:Uncharacterized protein n=1 Tax=Setomelanomma holmii TaxID=210430 RepID=A0A9P4H3F8_9PLEO|nr:hypothetical protein EK21DRAFT_92435 [Setomelanomma holmii]
MKTSWLCCLLSASAFAFPQPPTPPRLPTINTRPLRRANQVNSIIVGGPQDIFVPNSVVAALGDVLQFQFSNGNHTVTQSTAQTPCTPLENGPHCQEGQVMVVNAANAQQVAEYAKSSQATEKSVDKTDVRGGTVGRIGMNLRHCSRLRRRRMLLRYLLLRLPLHDEERVI